MRQASKVLPTCVFLLISLFFASGCAFGRKKINLEGTFVSAECPSLITTVQKPKIVLDSVVDEREFLSGNGLTKPSIGLGKILTRLEDTAEARACLIGRISNMWGVPCGDIISGGNFTVASHIKRLVRQALIDAGFDVMEDVTGADEDVYRAKVRIADFWGWLLYRHNVHARMYIEIERAGDIKNIISDVYTDSIAIWGSRAEWEEAYRHSAQRIVEDLTQRFASIVPQATYK